MVRRTGRGRGRRGKGKEGRGRTMFSQIRDSSSRKSSSRQGNNNNKDGSDNLAFALGSFITTIAIASIIPLIDALSPRLLIHARLIDTRTNISYPLGESPPPLLFIPPLPPPSQPTLSINEQDIQYYNIEFEIIGLEAEPQAFFIRHIRPDTNASASGWLRIDIARENVRYSTDKGGWVATVTFRLKDLLTL